MSKTDFLDHHSSRSEFDRKARLVAETDDPQEVFSLDRPLGQGWYRLQAQIGADAAPDPQVFFDFGSGFSEGIGSNSGVLSRTLSVPRICRKAHGFAEASTQFVARAVSV